MVGCSGMDTRSPPPVLLSMQTRYLYTIIYPCYAIIQPAMFMPSPIVMPPPVSMPPPFFMSYHIFNQHHTAPNFMQTLNFNFIPHVYSNPTLMPQPKSSPHGVRHRQIICGNPLLGAIPKQWTPSMEHYYFRVTNQLLKCLHWQW